MPALTNAAFTDVSADDGRHTSEAGLSERGGTSYWGVVTPSSGSDGLGESTRDPSVFFYFVKFLALQDLAHGYKPHIT